MTRYLMLTSGFTHFEDSQPKVGSHITCLYVDKPFGLNPIIDIYYKISGVVESVENTVESKVIKLKDSVIDEHEGVDRIDEENFSYHRFYPNHVYMWKLSTGSGHASAIHVGGKSKRKRPKRKTRRYT